MLLTSFRVSAVGLCSWDSARQSFDYQEVKNLKMNIWGVQGVRRVFNWFITLLFSTFCFFQIWRLVWQGGCVPVLCLVAIVQWGGTQPPFIFHTATWMTEGRSEEIWRVFPVSLSWHEWQGQEEKEKSQLIHLYSYSHNAHTFSLEILT